MTVDSQLGDWLSPETFEVHRAWGSGIEAVLLPPSSHTTLRTVPYTAVLVEPTIQLMILLDEADQAQLRRRASRGGHGSCGL